MIYSLLLYLKLHEKRLHFLLIRIRPMMKNLFLFKNTQEHESTGSNLRHFSSLQLIILLISTTPSGSTISQLL